MASKMDTETHYSTSGSSFAFNEAAVIGKVVTDVRSVRPRRLRGRRQQLTAPGDIARRSGCHLVRHPINLGQGGHSPESSTPASSRAPRSLPPLAATASTASKTAAMVDRWLGAGVTSMGDRNAVRSARGKLASRPPLMKRIVLQTGARLSRRGRRLGLTDTNNGLRVFNKTRPTG